MATALTVIVTAATVMLLGPTAEASLSGCGDNVTWTSAPDGSSTFGGTFGDGTTTATITLGTGGGNSGLAFSNNWSTTANTDGAFAEGFNSTGAAAIYGTTGGNSVSVAFNATVANPVVLVNYIDSGASMDFGANTMTVLDANGVGSPTVVGNRISLDGTNNNDGGWAVQITGTFGVATPLVFTFYNNNDTAGITIVKPGGTGCTATTTTTAATTTTTAPPTDYTTTGYFQPVDMNGVRNVGKAGATIPMKFRVTLDGVTQSSVSVVSSFVVNKVDCGNLSTVTDTIETTTSGATVLRYDATAQQFIQNWQTPKERNVCYRVTTTITDGDTLVAYFQLR
jgi:hypothetical protein